MCEGPETEAPMTVRNYVPRIVRNIKAFWEADKDASPETRHRFFQFGAGGTPICFQGDKVSPYWRKDT